MATSAESRTKSPLVALVGNPNAGKSSLFNALTGSQQKIGNYPGVTVEKISGWMSLDGTRIECVDVPGLYSMRAVSADESVATEVISAEVGERPDLMVYVLDSANLERNLFFYSQLVEGEVPVVVAVTMTDVLEREGKRLDAERLSELLKAPVVAVVAHKRVGVDDLKSAILAALRRPSVPLLDMGYPPMVAQAVEGLCSETGLDKKAATRALLEDNDEARSAVVNDPATLDKIDAQRAKILGDHGSGHTIDAQARYAWAAHVTRESVKKTKDVAHTPTDFWDRILTHRVFGLIIFVAVMYLVFQSIYTLAAPVMDLIDLGFDALKGLVTPLLGSMPVVQSLVVDGVITGIGAVLVFLPQICILFFFISVLEGTGYLARAAFLMDRLLGWCGLNGRAFIPLLSSFACAVPGIMAARVMPDSKSRLATVMVAPLMSCSARLPVYILLIGAFIEPQYGPAWAGLALFGMHFVGLFVAIPVVFVLNRGVLKGKRLPFTLELPRYQTPRWKDVGLSVYTRARMFLQTAGTIIFAMSIVIWALLFFPRSDAATAQYKKDFTTLSAQEKAETSQSKYVAQRHLRDSYLGQFGRTIEPAFIPAGFDWRLTTGILAAFPAREVVIPALGIIFSLGDDVDEGSTDLRSALHRATWPDGRPLMTPWNAVSMMVFFALCCQCMATLATIKRETNSWKWPLLAFSYMTTLAYIAAVGINWLGRTLS
ncbi:MAG TPA: ferrous iron transport protein B [Fimbriimonadaceae bacterium]|nr:ferrous iron transport protein B [Fimbriimonadaceae bacterium]